MLQNSEIVSTVAMLQLNLSAKELLIVLNLMDKSFVACLDTRTADYLRRQLQANQNDLETMIKKLHSSATKKQKLLQILTSGELTAIAANVKIFTRRLDGEEKLLSRVEMAEKKKRILNWALDGLDSMFPDERHASGLVIAQF